MKKKLFFAILVMAVVTFASVAVVSCKKDNENNTEKKSASADPMNEYLASFKEKLLSAQKGEETLSLEQAQRDLGNLLNYDFGDANYPTNLFHYDTIHTNLVVTDNQVDLAQLSLTYKISHDLIEKAYEQVNLSEKSVYTIHCTFGSEIKNDNTVDVQIVLTTRGLNFSPKSMSSVSPLKSSIDGTDCWHVWFDLGRCDSTDIGYDHVDILELVYNNNTPTLTCVNGSVYYTDINMESFKATSYPESGTSSYLLWTGYPSNLRTETVDPLKMSYYYENLRDIIKSRMELLYDNEYWVNAITCTIVPDSPTDTLQAFQCTYCYAKPHCTGTGPAN